MRVVLIEDNPERLEQLVKIVTQQNTCSKITVRTTDQELPAQRDVLIVENGKLYKVLPAITTEQSDFALQHQMINGIKFCVLAFTAVGKTIALRHPEDDRNQLENCLEEIFNAIGIKRNLLGTQYLRDAVRLIVPNPQLYNKRFTTKLYPDIAKLHNSSPAKIERSIRHCIEVCYNNGHLQNLNTVFKCNVIDKVYKPSNGELISFLAEQILHRLHSNCAG